MNRRFSIAIFALAASFASLPAFAGAQTQAPSDGLNYLVGNWSCVSNAGGKHQTYTTTWSRVLGGAWLRGAESSASETMIAHLAGSGGTWEIVHMSADGAEYFTGHGNDAEHIATALRFPKQTAGVALDRISGRQYTLTFTGDYTGRDLCTKQ